MSIDNEVNEPAPDVRREATVMELAAVIAGSRDFPECRSPEKAAVRILAGREMGIGPIGSVLGIRIQAGRVSMDAGLMAGAIKRSGRYDYRIGSHDEKGCVLEFFDNAVSVGFSSFSWDDATKAGLDKKDTWKNYPRNMLFARALSNGARWYCPGIFGGAVYTHEELGCQVDDEGRAVDAGAGSDLCTREQRQQIASLAQSAGKALPELLTDLGVRMLDELSGYEADKLIKKLTKQAAKVTNSEQQTQPTAGQPSTAPDQPTAATAAADAASQGQNMVAQAFEGVTPGANCSPEQRERILALAERLEPNEDACVEMIQAILARRNVAKIGELTAIQAASLIEAMEEQLKNDPPFESGEKVTVQATAH